MSKQLVGYIDYLMTSSNFGIPSSEGNDRGVNSPNNDEELKSVPAGEIDWEALFTENGKLTIIANPTLLGKLRPHLDSEYVNPVCAYSEVEDFYGDNSTMDMGEWMRLFKAIDWNNPYVSLSPTKENKPTERTKSKRDSSPRYARAFLANFC